jgi:sec-independent protein translocase protein TatC
VARRVRPIGHEDRLSLVEHLDELRTRLVIAAGAFFVALGLCFWQNHQLLKIVNDPLGKREPITLGVTEPFMTTLTVAAYAALLIAMPVILYEIYAFVLPAFSPGERKVALPLLLMVPFLFVAGVVFAYFVVIPAALRFLLHFNETQFNLQIRARDYYSFFHLTLLAGGIVFQLPVFLLGLVKMGITTPAKLRKNRRYAVLVIAVVAAALPGVDPISMLIEMVPLLVLYEASILLASLLGRPSPEVAGEPASAEGS